MFKHQIWNELIIYAKSVWKRVMAQIKISSFLAEAMLKAFDKTWGARNVLCRHHNLRILYLLALYWCVIGLNFNLRLELL